jgi:hypothetical protein
VPIQRSIQAARINSDKTLKGHKPYAAFADVRATPAWLVVKMIPAKNNHRRLSHAILSGRKCLHYSPELTVGFSRLN